MPASIRLPVTILTTGASYTARLALGTAGTAAEFVLDTGSAILAVDGGVFDPVAAGCTSTLLLQQAQYMSGSFLCAVVHGIIALGDAPPARLAQANIGVAYNGGAGVFGQAAGIWGLAYQGLDAALQMPADTWQTKYDTSQISLGKTCDITPLFDQFAEADLLVHKFAFRVNRAMPRRALADPADDPLNTGIFVAGGGAECEDLYTAPMSNIAVVDPQFYNVNLLFVQVGAEPPITVPPPPPGSNALSSAFIDTGVPNLLLDQDLYAAVIAAFQAINPDFAAALQRQTPGGENQVTLNIAAWPDIQLTFQAAGGGSALVTISATSYWQADAGAPGRAVAMLAGDNYALGGQSTLGLPFFAGKYVIFDRTAPGGHGVVSVAVGA